MSDPRLPTEMLDHIVDHLHDTEDALRSCCLVSKSWIPRTRKYLFADIKFPTGANLQSWKTTFPDPSTSPARYADTLSVGCPHAVTAADAEEGGWITGFSRAVHLEVDSRGLLYGTRFSLIPFHGFSLVVKSLCVYTPVILARRVLGLVLSFPLLEDLAVKTYFETSDNTDGLGEDETPTTAQPSGSPRFTGSLKLLLGGGTKQFTHRLLSLPGGIHFRKLNLTCSHVEDLSMTPSLVEGCSHSLESLDIDITCSLSSMSIQHLRPRDSSLLFLGGSMPASIDLSKATKLKDVAFRLNSWTIGWVVTPLQTASKHRDLQHILIDAPRGMDLRGGDEIYRQWSDLDHLLAQFWGRI
jgi:hypothetical protein